MKGPGDTPLRAALDALLKKDYSRFHMPGHKGYDRTGLFGGALRYDITEVDGADSLYHANGALLQTERCIAGYYGVRRSLISTQGSTLCIQTMLSLVRARGRTLIAARGAHTAAANAIALLDFDPLWLYPEHNGVTGVCAPVTPKQVEQALAEAKDCAAVYLTSPSYYGVLADVRGISKVCARYGVPLLVDAAHGAHLKAAGLPDPMGEGATMCAQSAHKTLPVLTGGAFLHIADEELAARAKDEMALFGSTSPSYLIMLSLDACIPYLETDAPAEFDILRERLQAITRLARDKGFTPVAPEGAVLDDTRLALCARELGYCGAELAAHFARCRIEPEYVGENTVVLLTSPDNTERDFARLREAISSVAPTGRAVACVPERLRPEQAMRPRDALFAPREYVPLEQAAGRVAARNQSSCPPGVPVVLCGERISPEALPRLRGYGFDRIWVVR